MAKGKITPELLSKIKAAVNIVEVVGENVVLRKSGSNYSGLCPFHSERSPSFSVSENKQLYHCYGCKKGGDLVSFVMEIHGLSFPDAIEELAERGRVALPAQWGGSDENEDPEAAKRRAAAREKVALAHKLNRFVAAFYHQLSGTGQIAHIDQYFKSRGVDHDWARNFYVGGAPASWDALSRHLVAKKAPLQVAADLGLIRPSQKKQSDGPGYFDLFRNRAMFPILDIRGKVAGFGGRALPLPPGAPDVGGESPKYLNSSESVVFQKSKLAYGLYQAQKHIREKDEVILVEGYFDVIALHAAGFQNVVATCGTSLTPDHLSVFRRLCSRVVILFDGDKAGISATERAMEIGLEQGMVLYGAVMPEGLDPDEILFDQDTGKLLPQGTEQVSEILKSSKPLLDARIEEAIRQGTQGPEAQTQSLKKIAAWLNRFRDPVGREVRAQSVPAQMGISRQLLEQAMRGSGAGNAGSSSSNPQRINPSSAPPVELYDGVPPGAGGFPAEAPGGFRGRGGPSPGPRRSGFPQRGGGGPVRRPEPMAQKLARPTPRDQNLLSALARGGGFSALFTEARRNLPPDMTISDLFDYPPAKEFVSALFQEPGVLERLRGAPEVILQGEMDPEVRSIVTEALVSSDPNYGEEDIRMSLNKGVARAWARFSQQIKAALAQAEANKDAGLQSQLMKEYLDVQRKMKEFISFYDEA